jgi:membrane associated rhomboid family serine protease
MLVLYYAGRRIEPILGSSLFLFIYLGCAVAAGIVVLTMDPNSGSYGASAGVAGIAGALMLYYLHGLRETWQHHKKKFLAFGLLAIYIMSNDLWGYSHGVHAIAFAVGMVLTLIVARLRCARWQVLIGFLFVTLLTTFAMVVSHWHQRL